MRDRLAQRRGVDLDALVAQRLEALGVGIDRVRRPLRNFLIR
jgi:hypothetical protein